MNVLLPNKVFKQFYFLCSYNKMSIQSKCQTCGRKIPTAGGKLSSIEFRRTINDINTLDKLISSKEYIGKFVYSKFRLIKYADNFLEKLEEEIQYIDPIAKDGTCNCFLKSAILRIFDRNYDMYPQIRNCPQF
jgi:hypothetical protein